MIAYRFDLRTWIDQPAFEHLEIRRQPRNAVRIDAPRVGSDEHIGGSRRVVLRDFTTHQHACRELMQSLDRICIHLCGPFDLWSWSQYRNAVVGSTVLRA